MALPGVLGLVRALPPEGLQILRAPTQRESYQESPRLEIFTTSPELGAWMNLPPPR
jgi:hypothetical protein